MPTLMPFDPDASDEVHEGYGYLTDIITGYDGTEQRRRLRATPQRTLEYTVFLENEALTARFRALVHRGQDGSWYVPMWQYARPLTVAFTSGGSSIFVDTTDIPFRASAFVVIWASPTHAVVGTVSSLSVAGGRHVVLTGALTDPGGGFPVGTPVMPCEEGFLSQAVTMSPLSRDAWKARLPFILKSMAA